MLKTSVKYYIFKDARQTLLFKDDNGWHILAGLNWVPCMVITNALRISKKTFQQEYEKKVLRAL